MSDGRNNLVYIVAQKTIEELDSDTLKVLYFLLKKVYEQGNEDYAIISMSEIERTLLLTRQRVRTMVERLVKMEIITNEITNRLTNGATNKATKVTILNTDSYRLCQPTTQPMVQPTTTVGYQPIEKEEKDTERKKEKEIPSSSFPCTPISSNPIEKEINKETEKEEKIKEKPSYDGQKQCDDFFEFEEVTAKSEIEEEFDRFNSWIDRDMPDVRKIKDQMTLEQWKKLRLELRFEKIEIATALENLYNWADFTKKRKSVYLSTREQVIKLRTQNQNNNGRTNNGYTDRVALRERQWSDLKQQLAEHYAESIKRECEGETGFVPPSI